VDTIPVQQRDLIVICGLPTAGKTTLTQALKKYFSGEEYQFVSMDAVREKVWGSKKRLTSTEHVYKNRVTEREAQNAFVVHDASRDFYDAVMLTHQDHQKPLVAMVKDTEDWLSDIQQDKIGTPADIHVNIKCVWLPCPPDTIEQRIRARFDNPEGLHSVDMDSWYALERRFEPISEFSYRQFDTSQISLEALVSEVIKYINE
jgi:predicted kinase